MKFSVDDKFFEQLPSACFAIVVVSDLDNSKENPMITKFLSENEADCLKDLDSIKVKEADFVQPYREAFRAFDINPNKFMCSIEALLTRISKGKGMPTINTAVDLCNAISLKYKLPIGAHDINSFNNDEISIRFANSEDTFIPFGSIEKEAVDEGEVIYVSGHEVRTRRWTWRQSEAGKITEETTKLFIPIDAFSDFNKEEALAAQAELADLFKTELNCTVATAFVDKTQPEIEV
jgi:DNA/RNA-binding domain of Phe-tRNA-synthetase-like protein